MSEASKITDLCYTASFMFDRLADISMQVHDLEKESIKTPITVEDIERNVIKFNAELEDVPRMSMKELRSRAFVPRRSGIARPLDNYRAGNPYYQMPSTYRLVSSNAPPGGRIFNTRNDQMSSQANSSVIYRKRPAAEELDSQNDSKQQVRGIKWVAASGQDVQKSGLTQGNLAKTSNGAPRREYSTMSTNQPVFPQHSGRQSSQQSVAQASRGSYQIWPKQEPLSPIRNSRPFSAINLPASEQLHKTYNEDDAAVNSLLMSFNENNESEASSGVEF
ncbi:hypothetical protein M3Y97_00198900 [Aphelenchoides bicaudatus]|nr:hypothetical protein M3Y97_00198900 [Aphelenchoides bicaudatus]